MVSLSTPKMLRQCYLPNLSYLLVNERELKNKCVSPEEQVCESLWIMGRQCLREDCVVLALSS